MKIKRIFINNEYDSVHVQLRRGRGEGVKGHAKFHQHRYKTLPFEHNLCTHSHECCCLVAI